MRTTIDIGDRPECRKSPSGESSEKLLANDACFDGRHIAHRVDPGEYGHRAIRRTPGYPARGTAGSPAAASGANKGSIQSSDDDYRWLIKSSDDNKAGTIKLADQTDFPPARPEAGKKTPQPISGAPTAMGPVQTPIRPDMYAG